MQITQNRPLFVSVFILSIFIKHKKCPVFQLGLEYSAALISVRWSGGLRSSQNDVHHDQGIRESDCAVFIKVRIDEVEGIVGTPQDIVNNHKHVTKKPGIAWLFLLRIMILVLEVRTEVRVDHSHLQVDLSRRNYQKLLMTKSLSWAVNKFFSPW